MKKFFLSALALMLSAGAMAQDGARDKGVTATAFVGINAAKLRNSLFYDEGKAGATMGVKLDFMLPGARGVYLSAGLDWTQKGAKAHVMVSPDLFRDALCKLRLHYLEVPVRLGYRFDVSGDLGLYGEVGPYFAVGLGGKNKMSIDEDGSEWRELEDLMTYPAFKKRTDAASFQRWDAGLGFRVGAEFRQRYNVMLGCDWGVTDMWRDDYRDHVADTGGKLDRCKNFSFTLAVGYRF